MENTIKCKKCVYYNPVIKNNIEIPCEKYYDCDIIVDGIPQYTLNIIETNPLKVEFYPNPNPYNEE